MAITIKNGSNKNDKEDFSITSPNAPVGYNGANGDDFIRGTAFADILQGGNGSDTIFGGAGNDNISGDADSDNGRDSLDGGDGNDTLSGGNGIDTLIGGAGDDSLDGGNGDDVLQGNAGKNTVNGGNGTDTLTVGGNLADFTADFAGSTLSGAGETTKFSGIEFIKFGDVTVAVGAAKPTIDVVAASDSGTSNTDNISNAKKITVEVNTGVRFAGDTITLYSNGVAVATKVLTAAEAFAGKASVTSSDLGADGVKALTATVKTFGGESLPSDVLNYTLDTTIATPTIKLASDTGSSDSDGITKSAALTLSTYASDVTRTFKINGESASALPTTFEDGEYSIEVTDTDKAGNSASATLSFTLDTTIATPTIALTTDSGSDTDDLLTNNPALTISRAAADVTRVYKINGGDEVESLPSDLEDGEYTVEVFDTDTAGNTANASLTFTLDTTIETPTIELASDTGSSDSDGITKSAALTLSTYASDVTRTFKVNGESASALPTTFEDGEYSIEVTDTDKAGNSASATLSFTLDTTIATPTIALTTDSGSDTDDLLTNNPALTISRAAADVTRVYKINGGDEVESLPSDLEDGEYTVEVFDTDTAGNTANASLTFTLDTTIETPTIELASDTGSSDSDGITKSAALTLSTYASDVTRTFKVNGESASALPTTFEDGEYSIEVTDTDKAGNSASATLSFTLDTTIATPTIALTTDSGSDTADLLTNNAGLTISAKAGDVTRTYQVNNGDIVSTLPTFSTDGTYTVKVIDTDTAGNTANASLTFKLDKTIATPTIELASDTGSSSSDGITKSAALTLSTFASDVTRSFKINNVAASSLPASFSDGAYTIEVSDTDKAGNTASATLSFTLDTTIATPTIALSSDSGSSTTDKVTNNAGLTISDKAGDVTRTYQVNNGQVVSTQPTISTDGTYTVKVIDTDTAGNTANASLTFTLDTQVTTGTLSFANLIDTAPLDDGKTTDNTFDLSLSGSETGATVVYQQSTNGGTSWTNLASTALSGLAVGSYSFRAQVTDAAGNSSNTNVISIQIEAAVAARTATAAAVVVTGTDTNDKDTEGANLQANSAASNQADTVVGGTGNDTLNGQSGNDVIYGKGGNDTILGGNGDDVIYGGTGTDSATGGNNDDTIYGGSGNDTIFGDDGKDVLYGGSGNDSIVGNKDNDIIYGGLGADTLEGGDGNDVFVYLRKEDTGDTINNFEPDTKSNNFDKIDFSELFMGTLGFSKTALAANSVYVFTEVVKINDISTTRTVVQVDLDGDLRVAELEIIVTGDVNLTAGNFIL